MDMQQLCRDNGRQKTWGIKKDLPRSGLAVLAGHKCLRISRGDEERRVRRDERPNDSFPVRKPGSRPNGLLQRNNPLRAAMLTAGHGTCAAHFQ